jgi:hypothetical protein
MRAVQPLVAFSTKRNQISLDVGTKCATPSQVVNIEILEALRLSNGWMLRILDLVWNSPFPRRRPPKNPRKSFPENIREIGSQFVQLGEPDPSATYNSSSQTPFALCSGNSGGVGKFERLPHQLEGSNIF